MDAETLVSWPASSRRKRSRKKTEVSDELYIPDDIIIDILSRLPFNDVLRSQRVCKRWSKLTQTRDFTDSYNCCSRVRVPMILKNYSGKPLLISLWEPKGTKSKSVKLINPYKRGILFSQDGIIGARGNKGNFKIYNPIYNDVVINIDANTCKGEIFGVFFHPIHKEFCSLWGITMSRLTSNIQYKILNLESNPKWQDIRNPCTQKARMFGIPPILIDMHLYWMVKRASQSFDIFEDCQFDCDIIEYDIRKEEFKVVPCPVPIMIRRRNFNMNLIDINGVVSLVEVHPRDMINIRTWSYDDKEELLLWRCISYKISNIYSEYGGVPKPVAYWNGELFLHLEGALYACDLDGGNIRRFGQKYDVYSEFLCHVKSLVSLRNCKSDICMVEEG